MFALVTGLIAAFGIQANGSTGVQSGQTERPEVARMQKMNPTAFRQPQPVTVRTSPNLDTRYYRTKRHPYGLAMNLRVAPQHSKSNVFAGGGISPVLVDPKFHDKESEDAVVRGVQRMPTRAHGIPNAGLEIPNIPYAKLAAYRSNVYLEPGQAEIHYLGNKKSLEIPMDWDRNTELGPFHYPHEIYSVDVRSEVGRRMRSEGQVAQPAMTRQPYREHVAQKRALAEQTRVFA